MMNISQHYNTHSQFIMKIQRVAEKSERQRSLRQRFNLVCDPHEKQIRGLERSTINPLSIKSVLYQRNLKSLNDSSTNLRIVHKNFFCVNLILSFLISSQKFGVVMYHTIHPLPFMNVILRIKNESHHAKVQDPNYFQGRF